MGLLLKSLSRIDSLTPAAVIEPPEETPRATREPSRVAPERIAVPLENRASRVEIAIRPADLAVPHENQAATVQIAARPTDLAAPLETSTSTTYLAISAEEPLAPTSDVPVSLEALFAVPFPSSATHALAAITAPVGPQAASPAAPADFSTALERLEQLQQTLADDVASTHAAPYRPSSAPVAASLKLLPEIRELCDHLLSRFPLTKHSTILVVDAGRAPLDHTWLLPLATGLLDSIASSHPRALLVEIDPHASGIAQMLGIDATFHSSDGAGDTAAFSHTHHPQIDILRLAPSSLTAVETRLEETWTELQESYNLILVAAGPLARDANGRDSDPPNQIVRSLLPLADGVILSVELGSTPVSVASQTTELLKAANANLLGCIVQASAVE
jgi:Mrp family chromosome partitioning ATPase